MNLASGTFLFSFILFGLVQAGAGTIMCFNLLSKKIGEARTTGRCMCFIFPVSRGVEEIVCQ